MAEATPPKKETPSAAPSPAPSPVVSRAPNSPAAQDPAKAAAEAGAGAAAQVVHAPDGDPQGNVRNDQANDSAQAQGDGDTSGGNDAAGGEGEGEGEAVTADDVTKRQLKDQAATHGLDTSGTKEALVDRIEDAGHEVVEPKGKNGCLTDPDCTRPAHPAAPFGHAYGQESGSLV